MTERDEIEAAAQAAGVPLNWPLDPFTGARLEGMPPRRTDTWDNWNPLSNDGDAFRLAVKLRMNVFHAGISAHAMDEEGDVEAKEGHERDPYAATRRAIVRAAAAMAPETA